MSGRKLQAWAKRSKVFRDKDLRSKMKKKE